MLRFFFFFLFSLLDCKGGLLDHGPKEKDWSHIECERSYPTTTIMEFDVVRLNDLKPWIPLFPPFFVVFFFFFLCVLVFGWLFSFFFLDEIEATNRETTKGTYKIKTNRKTYHKSIAKRARRD